MPYKSEAQQRFMHAVHPGIAARWDKETNFKKKLPKKLKKKVTEGYVTGIAKLAESLTRFKTLTRVHPGVQRLRRFAQTNMNNFKKKGLSTKGRDLRSALRAR